MVAREKAAGWRCAARHAVGANDPQDCDWPTCGCDPYATKVVETLIESGWKSPSEQTAVPIYPRQD